MLACLNQTSSRHLCASLPHLRPSSVPASAGRSRWRPPADDPTGRPRQPWHKWEYRIWHADSPAYSGCVWTSPPSPPGDTKMESRISMKKHLNGWRFPFLWALYEKIRRERWDAMKGWQWHGEPRTNQELSQVTIAPSESIIAASPTRIRCFNYMQWDSLRAHRCVLPVSSCTAAVPASASPHSANRQQQLRQSITKNNHRTSF